MKRKRKKESRLQTNPALLRSLSSHADKESRSDLPNSKKRMAGEVNFIVDSAAVPSFPFLLCKYGRFSKVLQASCTPQDPVKRCNLSLSLEPRLDVYRKVPTDLTQATTSGAIGQGVFVTLSPPLLGC